MTKKPMHNGCYYAIFALFSIIFIFSSCARKAVFNKSSQVPAAEGYVKIKKDKNSNLSLSVSIDHLAAADQLSPSRNLYIVWIDTESNGAKNIGQLNTGSSFFSGKLKGSLNAITSFKPVRVYITAEDKSSISYPGGQMILTTDVF